MHVCVCICICYVCMYIGSYVCMCVYVYVCAMQCINIMCAYTYLQRVYTHIYNVCIYIFICLVQEQILRSVPDKPSAS